MNTSETPSTSSRSQRSTVLWPAFAMTVWFVVVTGLVFPLAVYGIAQVAFPRQANGSFVHGPSGQIVGSVLIGQNFTKTEYFHPRPSAAGSGYDAANSGGTNLAPTSDKLINGLPDDPKTRNVDESFAGVKQLAVAFRNENGLSSSTILPTDAVTRSASGLDPHISVANAMLQSGRVARARGMSRDEVLQLVRDCTDPPFLGVFGDPAVNVLKLNLALDQTKKP